MKSMGAEPLLPGLYTVAVELTIEVDRLLNSNLRVLHSGSVEDCRSLGRGSIPLTRAVVVH